MPDIRAFSLFLFFFSLYAALAWVVSGSDAWWVIDFVDGQNVFFGDDAYRFFLSRGAWVNPDLYSYNFVLPGQLFLDGTLINLVGGDIFLSRCLHGAVGAAGLSLLYLNGREMGIPRGTMLVAAVMMGLIPRYALMSLSFYGEAWLGFFAILSLLLFLRQHWRWLAFVAAWLPLLRPEGILFLVPLGLALLRQRKWPEIVLLLLPGSLYFLYLCVTLESLADYSYWRQELRTILNKLEYPVGEWALFSLYSFFLTVPAIVGLCFRMRTRLMPFVVGCFLWIAWFQLLVLNDLATFENRYSFVLVPFLVLLWAICIHEIQRFLAGHYRGKHLLAWQGSLAALFALAVVGNHLDKTGNVSQAVRKYGYSGLLERVVQGRWDELYGFHPRESLDARQNAVAKIEELLAKDAGIDNVSIYTNSLFYYLDPAKIPSHVTVGFLTNGYMVFHLLLDGQSFIQHAGGRMYTYMDYGEPDFSHGERRAVVVTVMPLENYPYTWKEDTIEMYLFSYVASDTARVDISQRPQLTPLMLQEAYEPWYGK